MANLSKFSLSAEWNWATEKFDVTGSVTFMFGATMYTMLLNQQVIMPNEYSNVCDQIEHVFIDVSERLGRLSNAQLTLEASEVQPYL